jgi:HPt (histidine-containing phosphotransfer) domain-containing protein
MYYGYNDNKQLIMADEAFIELLGYSTFNELFEADIIGSLEFKNNKISIQQENQKISSDFMDYEVYGSLGKFYLVELKNITVEKTIKEANSNFKTNYKAIYLNVNKISEDIGLSVEDYKLYLDSFIDQSIIDEKRLLEGDDRVIKNLSNLALTLKIPHINILLLKIQKLSHRERMPLIDQYYTKLALLTLEEPEGYVDENFSDLLETDSLEKDNKEEVLNARFTDLLNNISQEEEIEAEEEPSNQTVESKDELFSEINKEPFIPELEETETKQNINNSNTTEIANNVPLEKQIKSTDQKIKEIQLENVSALPISYSPQTAADELNLPVVLIEEFVDDFIEQARHDKDHLLTSYYQKDMDNIHELGHKLKGAASNLRINELADILEEIQFCTDHSQLEPLFIKYWGHFLSLEDYMKQLKRT